MTAGSRQRLHPLTPLLKGARLLATGIAVFSWNGYERLGPLHWSLTVLAGLGVAVVVSTAAWAVTGFQVAERELRVREGLLWRRSRAIPLERVQSVDLVRPPLARLLGLAELRLEVIGGKRSEGSLAYLTAGEAARLRTRLLSLVSGRAPEPPASEEGAPTGPPTGPGQEGGAPTGPGQIDGTGPAERVVHTVANRDVLVSQLLTVPTWLVPLGIAANLVPLMSGMDWSFIQVASTLTALVGVAQLPVRRVVSSWNFRISTEPTGLRLRHGLLETRSESVPPQRVQAVSISRPLLWRRRGWSRVRIDVAGYGAEATLRVGTLLPVADQHLARAITNQVLTDACGHRDRPVDVTRLALAAPPSRARWLSPLACRHLGIAVTDQVVAVRQGPLPLFLTIAPLTRVQSVRVVQGPLQRALRLAVVHVDTAGIRLPLIAYHRDEAEAHALAETIATAARAARRGAPAARTTS
ncbi:MAG: PH domain-containing protein [Dactylosporangium sp.]|nr:PH domain-containing protein [Dactylosporangium sp.]NNJ62475.1 PH domain-containing protein [Dactylosporangium sp.]